MLITLVPFETAPTCAGSQLMETTSQYENLTVHYYYVYKGTVQCPKTGGQVGKQVHII
jgi:hypothetical protein